MTLTLDPAAVARARSLGGVGVAWLERLPGVVGSLADDWGLTVERSLRGGTASWTGLVRSGDGSTAVLKVALPHEDLGREVAAMVRADGRGYARVLRQDPDRSAVLLEALGPIPDPAVEGHVALMRRGARVLRVAWSVDRDPDEREAPDEDPKVAVLRALIDDELARVTEPVPPEVVERARSLLDRPPRRGTRGGRWSSTATPTSATCSRSSSPGPARWRATC